MIVFDYATLTITISTYITNVGILAERHSHRPCVVVVVCHLFVGAQQTAVQKMHEYCTVYNTDYIATTSLRTNSQHT